MKNKNKNIEYLCCYSMGEWEDIHHVQVFVTRNKKFAEKWVKKFNKTLANLTEYYKNKDLEDDLDFFRANQVKSTNYAYMEEVERREDKFILDNIFKRKM